MALLNVGSAIALFLVLTTIPCLAQLPSITPLTFTLLLFNNINIFIALCEICKWLILVISFLYLQIAFIISPSQPPCPRPRIHHRLHQTRLQKAPYKVQGQRMVGMHRLPHHAPHNPSIHSLHIIHRHQNLEQDVVHVRAVRPLVSKSRELRILYRLWEWIEHHTALVVG